MKYIAPIGQVKRNLDGEVLTLYSHLLHSYFRAYGMKVAYTIGTNDLVIF